MKRRIVPQLDITYEVIKNGLSLVPDQKASQAASLYPQMSYSNELIPVGTRINWNGQLKRAAVDLWDLETNNPDNAPTLWVDINYKLGYRVAPEIFTSTNAAAKGECLWFGDLLYQSLIEGNVYTPEQYAAGWEQIML